VAPRAEQVAGRRNARVRLLVDIDQLLPIGALALLQVGQADGALDLVDVARSQADDLADATAGLPESFEQQPMVELLVRSWRELFPDPESGKSRYQKTVAERAKVSPATVTNIEALACLWTNHGAQSAARNSSRYCAGAWASITSASMQCCGSSMESH
jgi:hypothetical protein